MGFLWFGYGAKLRRIEHKLDDVLEKEKIMSDVLTAVQTEVAALVVDIEKAIALLQALPPDDRAGEAQVLADLQAVHAKLTAVLPVA
jgi:hypothetical protein